MTDLSSAQGRYYITSSPVASPGQCAICGYSGNDRRYLDPRLDFEFYGSVIFCEECMASMAQQMGFLTPEIARELEARVEAAETELIRLRAATAAMEDFRVALGSLGVSAVGSGDHRSSISVASIPTADQIAAVNVIGEPEGDSEADVTALLPGSDDVRDDSADGKSFDFGL